MSFEQLKLKNQLCHRLYMASNSIARAYREPLAALNLTYPQYVVMMALWERDKITIAQLIDKTAIDGRRYDPNTQKNDRKVSAGCF